MRAGKAPGSRVVERIRACRALVGFALSRCFRANPPKNTTEHAEHTETEEVAATRRAFRERAVRSSARATDSSSKATEGRRVGGYAARVTQREVEEGAARRCMALPVARRAPRSLPPFWILLPYCSSQFSGLLRLCVLRELCGVFGGSSTARQRASVRRAPGRSVARGSC